MTTAAQPTRVLGRTGLPVTALGYGAMELRGAPRGRDISDEDCRAVLNAVLDTGINYVDTSIDYGRSERLIGEAIAGRRSEYFLASKCGCVFGSDATQPVGQRSDHVFTPENVISGVNGSLERLRTDYLDLVQFHISPSMQTLRESGSLEALKELQRAGKVRFIGKIGRAHV